MDPGAQIDAGLAAGGDDGAVLCLPGIGDDVRIRIGGPGRAQTDGGGIGTGVGRDQPVIARIGLGHHGAVQLGVEQFLLMARIFAGQAVAVVVLLAARAVEIGVKFGEIGLGIDGVVVGIDGDQPDRAGAAIAAPGRIARARRLKRDAVLIVHQELIDRMAVGVIGNLRLRAVSEDMPARSEDHVGMGRDHLAPDFLAVPGPGRVAPQAIVIGRALGFQRTAQRVVAAVEVVVRMRRDRCLAVRISGQDLIGPVQNVVARPEFQAERDPFGAVHSMKVLSNRSGSAA